MECKLLNPDFLLQWPLWRARHHLTSLSRSIMFTSWFPSTTCHLPLILLCRLSLLRKCSPPIYLSGFILFFYCSNQSSSSSKPCCHSLLRPNLCSPHLGLCPNQHLILHLCPFRINSHSYSTLLVTEHVYHTVLFSSKLWSEQGRD